MLALHDGVHASDFASGLLHPLTGPDHLCIALLAGVLAAGLARRLRAPALLLFALSVAALHRGGADRLEFTAGVALGTLLLGAAGLTLAVRLRPRAHPLA
jgi:hydrogenase/urease accessory protein HupE